MKSDSFSREEVLKMMEDAMRKTAKMVAKSFTSSSMKYCRFDIDEPTFSFSLDIIPEGCLGVYDKSKTHITLFLPSFKDTVFMQEFLKGNDEELIKFLTESIQHEYIHSCLHTIALFSDDDEEMAVNLLLDDYSEWWRKKYNH